MNDIYILGIESSCDETSISVVKNGTEDVYTCVLSQMDTFASYGGVVPEIASRMHTENITIVLDDVLKKSGISIDMISAIAVTYAPGLMGCLLVGLEAAKAIAYTYNKPLIKVHHIAGHIYANNLVNKIEFPSLALVVSGGHTELVLMHDDYNFEVLGRTLDDAIGECFDKVARVLELKYPGGPNVENYAKKGLNNIKFTPPKNDDTLDFSYSGLKSQVINYSHNLTQKGQNLNKFDLACSFQCTAIEQIVRKTKMAIEKTGIKRLIVAGGVSANGYLREQLNIMCAETNCSLSIPPLKYCTDNATMIAAAAYPLYKNKCFIDYNTNAKSHEYFFDIK